MATSKKQRSKSKRPSSKSTSRNYGDLYKDKGMVPAASTAATAESAASSVRDVNWGTEYAYVLGDLRQLFLVSLVVIVLMIAVGFLI